MTAALRPSQRFAAAALALSLTTGLTAAIATHPAQAGVSSARVSAQAVIPDEQSEQAVLYSLDQMQQLELSTVVESRARTIAQSKGSATLTQAIIRQAIAGMENVTYRKGVLSFTGEWDTYLFTVDAREQVIRYGPSFSVALRATGPIAAQVVGLAEGKVDKLAAAAKKVRAQTPRGALGAVRIVVAGDRVLVTFSKLRSSTVWTPAVTDEGNLTAKGLYSLAKSA